MRATLERTLVAAAITVGAMAMLVARPLAQQSLGRPYGMIEFTVTQNSDCSGPASSDQITILFSDEMVSPTVPDAVLGDDILAEFSFSGRDLGRGSLTFRRRSSDRSFLNARFIRVVNTGADSWCSGFLSMVVDGRPFLTRVPMFPRRGIPSNSLQNFNREQWANKTYWEAPLASIRSDRLSAK
jgi:hypothetical protein